MFDWSCFTARWRPFAALLVADFEVLFVADFEVLSEADFVAVHSVSELSRKIYLTECDATLDAFAAKSALTPTATSYSSPASTQLANQACQPGVPTLPFIHPTHFKTAPYQPFRKQF